ncbi:hypothetical protein G6F56_013249 [Rhizopus delemar]|nr:hypothetical protein G6F56_013249 [Rhizopus delemar]
MTDERNTSYSSTRSDSYSSYAWPLSKSRPLLLETSPHYPSPPMTYPMYDESSALTPSYQGYSEVSQSSPTLFWPSHHILTPENKLYGHSNDNRDSLQYNHLIEQESFGKFYAFNKNNKAHVRFKSDGCFSSNRPMPRKFLSPPLPTSSLKNSTEKDATSKS